jgi:hypothetical protein
MQSILDKLKAYITSDFLNIAWILVALYLVVWGIAWVLARMGNADRTLLYRCCHAWFIAMLIHCLAVTGLSAYWFFNYQRIPTFWSYFPVYLFMLVLDIPILFGAHGSKAKFADYHQN